MSLFCGLAYDGTYARKKIFLLNSCSSFHGVVVYLKPRHMANRIFVGIFMLMLSEPHCWFFGLF